MSSHQHLSAATNDRKARLAQLKSLKRKQAPSDDAADTSSSSTALTTSTTAAADASPSAPPPYLSGRNFDPTTRNVKLGFDSTPIANPEATLEYKAAQLALATKSAQDAETDDAPLDLFRLQPKKPNWDLKRDLAEKMRTGGLERGTEAAVARLVRERVEGQKRERKGVAGGEAEEVGLEGGELVEAMHQREVEEERERRRDAEEDADDADADAADTVAVEG